MAVIAEKETERRPAPNTNYSRVLDALQAGVARRDLPENTGLFQSQVSIVIRNLRQSGYLPKPTKTEKKQAISEAASFAQGGLSIAIRPYIRMGMAPKEIKLALYITSQGNRFSVKQIADALGKGRMRGYFPRLTEEEAHDIYLDSHVSEEELRKRVSVWCKVQRLIGELGLPPPHGRIEFKKVVNRHQQIQQISGWADSEDERGLFTLRGGRKCYQAVSNWEGDRVYDNFDLAKKRWEARQRNSIGQRQK